MISISLLLDCFASRLASDGYLCSLVPLNLNVPTHKILEKYGVEFGCLVKRTYICNAE